MASSSLRPGSTDNFLVRQESATAAAAAAEAEAVDNYLPEHANFGVAYDDDDRKAAATNLQSKWRGHSLRRKVAATQMVQKAVRGRLARKAIPAMRTAQEEKDAQVQAQQRQKQSREHRLKRLELELKMMESCDTNAYVKFMVHRQNRLAIKIQKLWRMKVNRRKMLKARGVEIEVTPELEKAVRKIQEVVRRSQIRWKQPVYPPTPELTQQLDYRIKAKLREPMPHASWENNPDWLEGEARKKFWQYRASRAEQQAAKQRRKVMRKDMEKMINQIECTSVLEELPSVLDLTKRGLLRSSQYRDANHALTMLHRGVLGQQ